MTDASRYTIVIVELSEDDGGGYYGFVPDLPGCASDGDTRAEALTNAEDAIAEWLREQSLRGVAIPMPGSAAAEAMEREEKLLDAIEDIAGYRENAEEKISNLERKLSELILLLKDESGQVPSKFSSFTMHSPSKRRRAH